MGNRHGYVPVLLAGGGILVALLVGSQVRAGDVRGQLTVTRVLTRPRVVLPVHQLRGMTPRPSGNPEGAVDEWARVVVYLEGSGVPPATPTLATIDQIGQRFEPELAVVPVGSKVSFPNSDPIFHNVFSLSTPREFDLGFYPSGETRLVTFGEAGVVQVYCHLHPEMSAAVVIVPNRFYTRPDEAGRFELSGIPAGTYDLVVWHRSAGFFRREVRVSEEGVVEISLEIPVEVSR